MTRGKITKITVEVEGKPITIDPTGVTAIFFTDEGVTDILAPYYDKTQKGGKTGKDVLNKWNPTDPTVVPPDYLIKMQDCTFN